MKKLLLFAVVAALLYVAVRAQEPGCCCDPILFNGSIVEDRSDCPANYLFTAELPELGQTCDEVCNATFAPVINITPPISCDSPLYKPAPGNVEVKPVKGQKALMITYRVPCPEQTYAVNISRCKGDDCDDFKHVAQVAPTGTYVDYSHELLWKTDYTYRLVLTTRFSGASEPAFATGNLNDIECWYRGYEKFCISPPTYNRFESYLKANGYMEMPAFVFEDFAAGVENTFHEKFNKAYFCSATNLLTPVPNAPECSDAENCVVDDDIVMCLATTPCDRGGIFGLYPTQESCEGTPTDRKYCFFDRSQANVDECYSCNPRMSCADYRTPGACMRDNCHAGNCSWHDVFPDLGIGVCVDSRYPNCAWCTRQGTPGLENNDAYNEVFDQCTAKKSAALSVPGYRCFFDRDSQESNACDATACMDYNATECGSPPEGIMLNPDNSLLSSSTDPCGIRVCQYVAGIGCFKNADGDLVSDCNPKSPARRSCELDYFAPNTSLVPVAYKPDRMDWLLIRMFDIRNGTDDGAYMEGKAGYAFRACVVKEGEDCADAITFSETNLSKLNFNDLNLQAGRDVIATMVPGANTLRFYGIDPAKNPEIVKEMTILACDRCQGPKVLEISVTPSRYYDEKFYTISDIPVITVSFNEPATLIGAALTMGNKVIPVTATPGSGANYEYQFIPIKQLDDGEYVLTFNSRDNNGLLMDFPGTAVIVVDTTPGDVTILPPDGTVINETSVDISIIFNEPATILKAVLENEVWTNRYAAKKLVMDLVPLLGGEGTLYTTTVDGLFGGKKNIRVEAEDLAGNPAIGKSSFWINKGLLQMRMREPSWGVSATYVFDIVIDTSITAQCKYAYDLPAPLPVSAFDEFLAEFPEETGVVHKIPGFNRISPGDLKQHKLYVYCKAGENISVEAFDLRVDPSPPVIKAAYAQPNVIVERRVPGKDIFTTYLKAQTDDDGFCKYSTENVPFVLMEGLFSGFDEIPKKSHEAEINVTQDNASYTYYVACKNTAELPSATVPVQFSVDLTVPFGITSYTPPYSNSTGFPLRFETNKRAFCYVGETEDTILNLVGDIGYAHVYPVEVNASGTYKWYVKCTTGAGSEIATITIPVTVDTTPPEMLYVNDSSNLPEEPEYSYFLDRLMVSFLGYDNETAVNAYYYRLLTFLANDTVLNWTLSTNTNGTAFYVTGLNLTDGNKYRFEVYPVNIVGLQGDAMASNGVTIDVEKTPTGCQNGVLDSGETDVDCGGGCPGCIDGLKCNANTDCISGFCNNGVCSIAGCDDGAKNGNETDIDCGGGVCPACADNRTCVQDSDCLSNSCNFGVCGPLDPCFDGVLTGTETDVDCGGSCPNKCGDSKNCRTTNDCAPGLVCIGETCMSEGDSDKDGVKDDRDKCPNTPADEVADEEGCSPSQRFTCGDEISDGWRIKHFGSVLCDGNGAPDADPDNDRLTNREEYRYGTDPNNPDTDYDRWTDKEEIDAGTNPLDPNSHPPSKLRILLWVLLIILILAVFGIGGWLGYQYYVQKRFERLPPSIRVTAPPKAPEKKVRPWPEIIEKLRKIARREEPGVIDKDWLSLAEVSERLAKEKVPLKQGAFDRLREILEGKPSRKAMAEFISEIQKEPKAFKMLRRISFERLTPDEKEFVRTKLAFLKAGRLTPAELEEILTKLRITAAYYKTHKYELERELELWLKEERRHKK